MKKKTGSSKSIPKKVQEIKNAQRPQNNTRGDIMSKTTDNFNNNNGPRQRSRKKLF
jgi:hypothetical protein